MKPMVFALAILAACSGSTEPGSSFAGTYTMQSIDGRALPTAISSSITVTDGHLIVAGNGLWSEVDHVTVNAKADSTNSAGTWTRNGDAFVFTVGSTGATHLTGTLSGARLDLGDGTRAYVYVR
jgi:hypothetical protein